MAKMTGLGRGLGALFNDENILNDEPQVNIKEGEEVVHKIKLIDIEPNANQPRRTFNNESIDELAESIKRYGVIQPIIVSKKDKYYEIIAGERRWRASKKAGLEEIPCIIRENSERKNKEIALIENIQREDLNPIEKARGIKMLMEEHGLTQEKVAEKLGKSRSSIANAVRILNLDDRVINLALEGKLTEGHCRSLMAITDPEKQYQMALHIIEGNGSVREIEKKMKVRKKIGGEKQDKYLPIYRDIENTFQEFFGTKVKLDAGSRSGKIIIKYNSNDDLERILSLLN